LSSYALRCCIFMIPITHGQKLYLARILLAFCDISFN
jgi:hypothetical protein